MKIITQPMVRRIVKAINDADSRFVGASKEVRVWRTASGSETIDVSGRSLNFADCIHVNRLQGRKYQGTIQIDICVSVPISAGQDNRWKLNPEDHLGFAIIEIDQSGSVRCLKTE